MLVPSLFVKKLGGAGLVVLFLAIIIVVVSLCSAAKAEELSLPQYDTENPNRQEQIDAVANQIQNVPRGLIIGDYTCELNEGPFAAVPGQSLAAEIITGELQDINSTVSFEDLQSIAAISASLAPDIDSLDDYASMYQALADGTSSLIDVPSGQNRIDDEAFAGGRLTLRGQILERVKPTSGRLGLRLDGAIVRDVCGTGSSLNLLRRRKRLYKEDYSWTADYNDPSETKYLPSCVAYYCVTADGRFMPLAIKVLQPDGGDDLVYTKFDTDEEWTLAKMAVNANYVTVITADHFVGIHLLLDPMRVTLMRNVHPSHPVYNLLLHHLERNAGVTAEGLSLLVPGSPFDLVHPWGAAENCRYFHDQLKEGGEKVTFQSFEEQMDRRGLTDLKDYKYRDDATRLMRTIRKFLRQHLRAYYEQGMADVKADRELQAFALEASRFVRGFPSRIRSVKQLIEVLSNVIYATTMHHHVTSNDMPWDVASLPYGSPSLNHPWPSEKGQDVNLLDYVVPNDQVGTLSTLIAYYKRNITLDVSLWKGYTQSGVNLGTRSDRAIARFESRMKDIDEFIEAREAGKQVPFDYLRPSRLPYFVWG